MTDLDQSDREMAQDEAKARASSAPHGIGAVFLYNVNAEDDGWHGVVTISDGRDSKIDVLVAVGADVPLGPGSVKPEIVAALVEEMAGDYEEDGRLTALQSATSKGPGLRLDDRFPDLWRSAFAS